MNYEEAKQKILNIPWKIGNCMLGEECWCRTILPTEPIIFSDKHGEDSIDEIISQGSLDKATAEYIIELHNDRLKKQ